MLKFLSIISLIVAASGESAINSNDNAAIWVVWLIINPSTILNDQYELRYLI